MSGKSYNAKPGIFILAVLGLHCCVDFSLVAVSGDSSLVAVHGLLIVVASLVLVDM